MNGVATPMLALDGVGVRIDGRSIVDGIDLHCEAGTVTALVGPNGAGKSTLLGVAAGDIASDSGSVKIGGRGIAAWPTRELARQRAVMLQDHAVRFAFSVQEVVAMGRLPYPGEPERDADVVERSLQAVGLTELAGRDVQTLSGGESARVAFARVLAQGTPLLFLDEPTAALDLFHQEALMRTVRGCAAGGACVVVVLHDLNLAAGWADRIVMLSQGRVAADGTPREVLTSATIEAVYHQRVQVLPHPSRPVPLVVVVDA